jgi:hypothetical protein
MDCRPVLASILSALLACGCVSTLETDCNKVGDYDGRNECLYNRSVALSNPTSCNDIPDKEMRENCIDDISVNLGDDIYCTRHDKLSRREICERKVADALKARRKAADTG